MGIIIFTFYYLLGWSGAKSTITEVAYWSTLQIPMIDGNGCGALNGMNDWQGKQTYSVKTCPSAALSTTNPT
jgi:hypothetical protein